MDRNFRTLNHRATHWAFLLICLLSLIAGCGSPEAEEDDFFTSGDREADQRAEQRVSKSQQLEGEVTEEGEQQQTLYDRLGGEKGVHAIVADFLDRVIADPRVNWERKGVSSGLFGRNSEEWRPSPQSLDVLQLHLTQFLSLATGGPSIYKGDEMKEVHEGMEISNAEFDATVGDLKATLDALNVPDQEQKELIAIVETTRAQIVEKR